MPGTTPGTHLLPHVTLSLQSQIRNAEGDKAVRKRDAYVTLKYYTLALVHSIRLLVQYTCPAVRISVCVCVTHL